MRGLRSVARGENRAVASHVGDGEGYRGVRNGRRGWIRAEDGEHQVRGEFIYLTAHLVGSGELVALVDEAFWLVRGLGVFIAPLVDAEQRSVGRGEHGDTACEVRGRPVVGSKKL